MAYYFTSKVKKEIGKKIKKARNEKGLKQVDVAVDAGINSSYYSKIERGEVNPSLDKIYRIAKSLGIKSSNLILPQFQPLPALKKSEQTRFYQIYRQ